MNRVLVVDDDDIVRLAISENLKDSGFIPVEASNGLDAIDVCRKAKPAAVILDLKMPKMNGIETLKEIRETDPNIPVIIITAHGDIPTAVEAIKLGAYDFITKPPDYNRLVLILTRAAEKYELNKKVERLSEEVRTSLEYILGKSRPIQKVSRQIHQISYSDFSVILQGETGTGKSFIARTIHNLSKRAKGPFISVDIGAIPETLVESELFGHEKGAFTGAVKKKKGYFEVADGGTLLIDELQNLSPYVQSKLLAAFEEKTIKPLGSTHSVKSDVRIIGATNTDIISAVKEKKSFREDLFYRLSEFIISLPPLRERTEDIPFLSEKFFLEAAEDLDKRINSISSDTLDILKKHSWPGNIRELKNVVRRAVLLSEDNVIETRHLEFLIKDAGPVRQDNRGQVNDVYHGLSLSEVERAAIIKALHATGSNKTRAAGILKINYTTLLRKIKQYNI